MALLLLSTAGACSSSSGQTHAVRPAEKRRFVTDYPELEMALLLELARLQEREATSAADYSLYSGSGVYDVLAELDDPDGEGGAPPQGINLSWSFRHPGDYDLNGVVDIADITPLGQYFNSTVQYTRISTREGHATVPDDSVADPALNRRLAQIDGDGNGLLNLADLTPIAANFGDRLDGYRVFRQGPQDKTFLPDFLPGADSAQHSMLLSEGSGGGAEPLRFEFRDEPELPGWYDYRVQSYDSVNGVLGEISWDINSFCYSKDLESFHMIYFGDLFPDLPRPVYSGGRLALVNNGDASDYIGYIAVRFDLQRIGADFDWFLYEPGLSSTLLEGGYDSVVWYCGGRGGPNRSLAYNSWGYAEQTDVMALLESGMNMLVMSQNMGVSKGLSWQELGFEPVTQVLPGNDLEFTEAVGLPYWPDPLLATGISLPVSTVSLVGSFQTDPEFDDGMGRDDGERYAGAGGRVPWAIRVPADAQFSTRAWNSSIMPREGLGGMCAAPGFQPGLFFSPYPEDPGHVSALVSWGCTTAPCRFNGYPPFCDLSSSGTARCWVIGYAWTEVEILQDPDNTGEPTLRCDMLCNVLEWLRE